MKARSKHEQKGFQGAEYLFQTVTSSSGEYNINLPQGKYKLKVHSHDPSYKGQWYNGGNTDDAFTWEDASVIELNSSKNVDVKLGAPLFGTVSGVLKDSNDDEAEVFWALDITLHDPNDESIEFRPYQVHHNDGTHGGSAAATSTAG